MENTAGQMVSDSDDEYEDTEILLIAEMSGALDRALVENSFSFQLMGVDEERPVLQLGSSCFVGRYDDLSGSSLVLKNSNRNKSDGNSAHSWSQRCFVDKLIRFERVFVQPKCTDKESTAPVSNENEQPSESPSSKEDAKMT